MKKPDNISMQDWLIHQISLKMVLPKLVINKVISHQFESVTKALITEESVEMVDFGKFLFNKSKAEKTLKKWHSQKELFTKMSTDESLSRTKRENAKVRVQVAIKNIEYLNRKKK